MTFSDTGPEMIECCKLVMKLLIEVIQVWFGPNASTAFFIVIKKLAIVGA